jgi:hypothetical protein
MPLLSHIALSMCCNWLNRERILPLLQALRHPPAAFKKQVFADDLQYLGLETKVSLEIQKV